MLGRLREFILRLRRDRRGAVGVMAAAALPVLIGMSSLVGEYGYVLLVKTENQRVADLAAYAGALAYTSGSSNTAMADAAAAVANLNGVPTTSVKTTLLANSPTGDGNPAVQVQITTNVPLYLAQVVGAHTNVPVAATAAAELSATVSPCVLALSSSGTGITLSGGTSLNTDQCSVGSNTSVAAPCGTKITTISVAYSSSVSPCASSSNIVTPSGTTAPLAKKSTADPLAGTSQVKAAYAGLANLSNVGAPVGPSVPSVTTISLGWSGGTVVDGCTFTGTNGVWNVVCTNGTHNLGGITVGGGLTVNFAVTGAATNVYTFSGPIVNGGGSTMTFGNGTFEFAGGLDNSGSSMTFGAGEFWVGLDATSKCGSYSICNPNGAKMTFGGPSVFIISNGVSATGNATTTFGSGTGNSFQVGPNLSGSAFNLGGGATTVLADATDAGSKFQVVGNIVTGGGSCTTISAANEHDIKGSISAGGALILGAGPYYISGSFSLGGSNNGGDVSCGGQGTVGLLANNVTLVLGGSPTGDCSGDSFCIGAGYGHVTLTAPTSGSLAGLAIVGPQSGSAGALFTAGATSNAVSGAIYFPSAPITLAGAATLGGGTGSCLEIIGSQVTLKGGSAAASNCKALSGSSTPSILLVQ